MSAYKTYTSCSFFWVEHIPYWIYIEFLNIWLLLLSCNFFNVPDQLWSRIFISRNLNRYTSKNKTLGIESTRVNLYRTHAKSSDSIFFWFEMYKWNFLTLEYSWIWLIIRFASVDDRDYIRCITPRIFFLWYCKNLHMNVITIGANNNHSKIPTIRMITEGSEDAKCVMYWIINIFFPK